MELCEIRIPTYQRPALLKRAIASLIAQDYPHWKAIIIDDSAAKEAESVVASFSDTRLLYHTNPRNLGSAGNIDQAFNTQSLSGGQYACVLEDDNWLLPTYLSKNISALKANNINLLLRNQEIWTQTEQNAQPTGRTTRGDWFTSKIYEPRELHAHLFFFEGASNGGLFWRTTMSTDLQVGHQVKDAGLQEYCRALQIAEPFKFETEALSCWAEMSDSLSLRNPSDNRTFARGIQSIRQYLLARYGDELLHDVSKIAITLNKTAEFDAALADVARRYRGENESKSLKNSTQYLKAYIRKLWTANPLKAYLST